MAWLAPTLQVQWGAYFKPDPAEQLQVVQMTQAALGGASGGQPLITKRIAVERLKPIFGIENVDAVLEELEKEAAAKADSELEKTTAELHAIASANAGVHRPAGGAKPSGDDSGGGGGASRAAASKKPTFGQ